MIRLFTAVTIPQNIRTFLHAMGRSLHGARAVPEEQLHITLSFIGEVEGTLFQEIQESLSSVNGSPFSLGIRGVGHFPPRGKPRLIWAGLESTEELTRLKRKVDKALLGCGLPPEGRNYSPHVTLARLHNCSLQRVTDFLSGNALLQFDPFVISRFHLYSSRLSHKGATHTVEASYPLKSS